MSIINSGLDEKIDTVFNHEPLKKTMLDIGSVFSESMKRYQSGSCKDRIITRCETLPVIEADKSQIAQLFDNLVSMIMRYPPSDSKLFLYVDCNEKEPVKVIGGNGRSDMKEYTIKFHTNISTNDLWKKENEELLIICEQFILFHKGTFGVNNINNTGCLFSLTFPGKL